VVEELLPITKKEFKIRQGVDLPPKSIVDLRWEHFEKVRKGNINEVLQMR
jgi:hypothetical protein